MISLNSNGRLLTSDSPLVMGVLNATPDSFYEGSRSTAFKEQQNLVNHLVQDGADIIDIGGMSSRPGAKIVSSEEELSRIEPIVSYCLQQYPDVWISIDTLHAKTARAMLEKGVHMINDISGGQFDLDLIDLLQLHRSPYVCMHMRGTPEDMITLNSYDDMIHEIMVYFKKRIELLRQKGVTDIIIDPGFGFAKNIDQNFNLLRELHKLQIFDCPILIGLSRKSMIYKTLNILPEKALNGTTALHMLALLQGVHILRVHDVKEAKEAILLYQKYSGKVLS